MDSDLDELKFDDYVISRFAEWAGDLKYAAARLSRFVGHSSIEEGTSSAETPLDFVRRVSMASYKRYLSLTHESEAEDSRQPKLFEERLEPYHPRQASDPNRPDEPIIETQLFRAVVHAISDREFEMRAFLTSLDGEAVLRKNLPAAKDRVGCSKSLDGFDDRKDGPREESIDWVVEGDFFCMVNVDDMGLVTARGIWTKTGLPKDPSPIFAGFRRILNQLERNG